MTLQTTNIDEGLDFILGHLIEPKFPRTISTHTTQARQIIIYGREEAQAWFKAANVLDCKIRAYPHYVEWKGLNRQSPNLILIDLDLLHFISKLALDRTLNKTLKNINEKLNGAQPTVLWSGGGYHIIQPIDAFLLEDYDIFSDNFEQPSRKFIQFAETFLSKKKSDPHHTITVSFKNCMLRLPGSYNSKYIQLNDKGETVNIPPEAEVKIIQRWDGVRPAINWLLRDFRRYLIQDRYEETRQEVERLERSKHFLGCNNNTTRRTLWIEKLLQIPLNDHRKFAVRLIFAPYFINFRRISYDAVFDMIKDWLVKCNSIQRLDFQADRYIHEKLKDAKNVGYFYITPDKIMAKNRRFYDLLKMEKVI